MSERVLDCQTLKRTRSLSGEQFAQSSRPSPMRSRLMRLSAGRSGERRVARVGLAVSAPSADLVALDRPMTAERLACTRMRSRTAALYL